MSEMVKNLPLPAHSRAVLIGIDGYGEKTWRLGGGLKSILTLASALKQLGVPADRIDLWLSPADQEATAAADISGWRWRAFKQEEFIRWIETLLSSNSDPSPSTLYFHWTGHGIVSTDKSGRLLHHLVLPEATISQPRTFLLPQLCALLSDSRHSRYSHQVVVVDTCRQHFTDWDLQGLAVQEIRALGRGPSLQCRIFACAIGQTTSQTNSAGSRLSEVISSLLETSSNDSWPQFMDAFEEAASSLFVEHKDSQPPYLYATDWQGEEIDFRTKLTNRDEFGSTPRLQPRVIGSIPTITHGFVGRKSVLTKMDALLNAEGSGVCTLLGLGGCGKSATLKRFEQRNGLFADRRASASPAAVFSWSFSQSDDLEDFFHQLEIYLSPLLEPSQQIGTAFKPNPLLLPDRIQKCQRRIVVILDGLERVLEARQSGRSSEISIVTPALRALIQRAAENECGELKIFITSRVALSDTSLKRGGPSEKHDLNHLPLEDCIQLLQNLGVKGTRADLKTASLEYKRHAYSLALLAHALSRDFLGDIRRRDRIVVDGVVPGLPLSALLKWYENNVSEPCIRFLKYACLFRGSTSINDISAVMERGGHTQISDVFTTRTAVSVLAELKSMGLLFVDSIAISMSTQCDLHPLIREYFYKLLLNPKELHRHVSKIILARIPDLKPVDAESISKLVEIIYHNIESGNLNGAWEIYRNHLGGYPYLGYARGDHPTGSKTVYMFLEHGEHLYTNKEEDLTEEALFDLYTDGALYLKNEGRLDDAIDLLQRADSRLSMIQTQSDRYASALLVRSGIEFLRARFAEALSSISVAELEFSRVRPLLREVTIARVGKELLSRRATVLAALGDSKSRELFERASAITEPNSVVPHDYLPIRYGWYLALIGNTKRAREVLLEGRDRVEHLRAKMLVHRLDAIRAFNELVDGRLDEAEMLISSISDWATKADLHIFVLCWQLRANLALLRGNFSEAESVGKQGLRHAGSNGFVIEWHDISLILARAALAQSKFSQARVYCNGILNGSGSRYSCSIPPAIGPKAGYIWAALPAQYIRDLTSISRSESANVAKESRLRKTWAAMAELHHYLLRYLSPPA